MDRPRSLFFPLALIAAGVIWLLVNFGYIPSSNLWALAYIWPFLLIAGGLGLILRSYWAEVGIVITSLLMIGVVAAVIYAPAFGWDTAPSWGWNMDWNAGGSVRGSRNIETETRTPGEFSTINIRYPAAIVVQQGDEAAVSVTADDNLLPQLDLSVRGSALIIENSERSWNRRVQASQTVEIIVTVLDLSEITFDSAGSLEINNLSGNSLSVRLNGAGSIELNDVEFTELDVRLDGAGSMDASGTVSHLSVQIDGLGSFNGESLDAQTAQVNVDGLGSATVRVAEELNVNIDGLGSVNYYGSPELHEETDGLGSVRRAGD